MEQEIIVAKNLVKIYKKRQKTGHLLRDFFLPKHKDFLALNRVNFSIKEGETFGLVGPNGAGKTTTIKILAGLNYPNSGTVLIEGKPVREAAGKIGLMLSDSMIYYRMTGYKNLKFYAKLYDVQNYERRINELAEFLGLADWLNSYVEHYSAGMKSKLALARALIHNPDILLLDEPTIGLDPRISLSIRHEIKKMGKTVLLTTHYMDEASEMCNRVAIINKGKIIRIDTPENLVKTVEKSTVVLMQLEHYDLALLKKLDRLPYVHHVHATEKGIKLLLEHKENINDLLKQLHGYELVEITEEKPTLTHAFIKLVGESR